VFGRHLKEAIGKNRVFWGILIATLSVILLIDGLLVQHVRSRWIEERTRQAIVLTQVVAEMIALSPDDEEQVRALLQTVVRGTIHYAQVVLEGEVRVEERSREAAHLSLPPLDQVDPNGQTQHLSLPDGPLLDLIEPLPRLNGYVRMGFSMVPLTYALLKETVFTVGISLGAWIGMALLLMGFFLLRARRQIKLPQVETEAEKGSEPASPEPAGSTLELNGLRIDDTRKVVLTEDGRVIPLSPKEYRLLTLLASEPGRVFSEEEIRRELWPDGQSMTRKDVTHYVYLLRKKLQEYEVPPDLIENVRGHGYKIST